MCRQVTNNLSLTHTHQAEFRIIPRLSVTKSVCLCGVNLDYNTDIGPDIVDLWATQMPLPTNWAQHKNADWNH